jgi:pimeloyl-ACP methyl ester carboxylesterase
MIDHHVTKQALAPQRAVAGSALCAEQMHRLDSSSRILRVWKTVRLRTTGQLVQYMRFGRETLRPLIWLHSFDYPMAPPWGMCVDAAERGYGIVSVRRPGFGLTTNVTDREAEVALISAFIAQMEFRDAILIAEGSSRATGIALARANPEIALTVLARPGYGSYQFGEVAPLFQSIVLQAIQTEAGARISMSALKRLARLSGHAGLYEAFIRGRSDVDFLRGNVRDLADAWACTSTITSETFRRELRALEPDPTLMPGALRDIRGVAVIGADTQDVWKHGFEARSAELLIPWAILPRGSLFALYQDTEALLQTIETELSKGRSLN